MNTNDIINELNRINAKVHIIRQNESWTTEGSRWYASIDLERDGIKLTSNVSAPTMSEAIAKAWGKIAPLISTPAGRVLTAPTIDALEAPKSEF